MRRAGAVVAVMLAAGCGADPPSVLVGQSAHFRLHVDPALLPVPPPFDGDNALAALESEWSDVETMLRMPDGVIDYYWYTQANAELACGSADEGACTKESLLEIDSPTLPNPHELNHAYLYLRQQRKPIPLLAEGAAESIACGGMGTPLGDDVAWPDLVVAAPPPEEAYLQGGLLARTLIRTQGIDAFLRYYEQSPEQRDPTLFAANFQAFWGMTIDEVWTAMHVQEPGAAAIDSKICPCSLPQLPLGATAVDDPARASYWVAPTGAPMVVVAPPGGSVTLADCSGVESSSYGTAVLADLDASPAWYASGAATVLPGAYLADDCASASQYPIPSDAMAPGYGTLGMIASHTASARTVYFQLGVPFPTGLIDVPRGVELCTSCAFDQGSCQPGTAVSTREEFPGTDVYGRWTIPAGTPGAASEVFELWGPLPL